MKEDFWDERYKKSRFEWGREPSPVAVYAANIIRDKNLKDVLDIGCGYGRDSIYLAKQGFKVTGIDTSQEGLKLARQWAKEEDLNIDFQRVDITKNDLPDDSFDAIIMYNTFHLMDEEKRADAVGEIKRLLRSGGVLAQMVISFHDQDFGTGVEVGKNTFDKKGGRPMHFFSSDEILEIFNDFDITRLEEVSVHEVHTGGEEHNHIEWLVITERAG